jgi:glutamate racemase
VEKPGALIQPATVVIEMQTSNEAMPVCIADTCVCGLSLIKSLWATARVPRVYFMADYAINPLGVKPDAEIAAVVNDWLGWARQHSNTLVMACNTLSIRYHQLLKSGVELAGLENVVSMVDCFAAMIRAEADRLAGRRVLVIGTEFTASQDVYPGLLREALPGTRVSTVPATALERRIARFEPWGNADDSVIGPEFRRALEHADVAVLACTCFPMARDRLQAMFPGVLLLDPGAYCAALLPGCVDSRQATLEIRVTGEVVEKQRVVDFARSYLGESAIVAL